VKQACIAAWSCCWLGEGAAHAVHAVQVLQVLQELQVTCMCCIVLEGGTRKGRQEGEVLLGCLTMKTRNGTKIRKMNKISDFWDDPTTKLKMVISFCMWDHVAKMWHQFLQEGFLDIWKAAH
jgi:hypothetical protein